MPSRDKVLRYRNVLKSLDFDLDTIIKKFKEGKKTILVECSIETGNGLASFLSVLIEWAREEHKEEELLESLDVVVILGKASNYDPGLISDKLCIKFPNMDANIATRKFKFEHYGMLLRLSEGVDKGKMSDRLVRYILVRVGYNHL